MNRENLKKLRIIILVFLALLSIISAVCLNPNKITKNNIEDKFKMTYAEVGKNENSTESEYVKFDAYFLKKEGENAKKVRGTAKELNDTDELYLELNVLTNGYLENGRITLTSGNYKIAREISTDNEISTVSSNVIRLNKIQNGTYKTIPILIEQNVIDMSRFITYNKNNLSKENTITFTGTHVAEDGTKTNITKTVKFNIDWYGSKNLNRIKSELKTYVADSNSDKVIIAFQTEMFAQNITDNNLQVPDKAGILEGTMPLLNGYAPTNVKVVDVSSTEKNLTYTYDTNTRKLEVRDEIIYNNGQAELSVYDERYKIKVTLEYPYIAYSSLSASTSSMNIKVSGYLEGYNNPNSEYTNPAKSSTGSQIVNVNLKNPTVNAILYETDIDLLSKANLRLMYDRNINTNNGYRVTWRANINLEDEIEGLIFKEDYINSLENTTTSYNYNTDTMQDLNGNFYSLEGISNYVGIKVPYSTFDILGDDGYIEIIDEDTQDIIKTITKNNVDKYISYTKEYSHIKIKTSKPLTTGNVEIYNYKNIDNSKFVQTYTKEQFNNMDKVYTALNGKIIKDGNEVQINGDVKDVEYEEGNVIVKIPTSMQLKKQKTNDVSFMISLNSFGIERDRNITEWINPTIILEYPEEIENVIIKKVTSTDGEITVKEIKNEVINNKRVIKITTEGATLNGSKINISHSVTLKSNATKSTGELRVFTYNELCDNWEYVYNNTQEDKDIYDINSNGNTEETRKVNITKLIYSTPTGLYTNTELTNFNSENTIVRGPDVAKVSDESLTKEVTIKLNIYNNYATPVTGMKIVGKVPFEGNTYQINGKELGSNFTAAISSAGMKLPDSIKTNVTVYYSTQEIVNENLEDSSNGWTTWPQNYDEVKTYLIDLSKITMEAGTSLEFSYNVKLPENLIPGNIMYAAHAIYFEENTASGIVNNSTETNKVGLEVISEQTYNLELTKYRVKTTNPIETVTFNISGLGIEEETEYITNSEGKITIPNLYLNTDYTIQEINTNTEYVLNDNPITFKVIKQDNKKVPVVVSGSFKEVPTIETTTDNKIIMKASLENEPKYQLNVVKQVKGEDTKIEGVKFLIKGDGISSTGKVYITNSEGIINITKLIPESEYTLQEISSVNGYVLNNTPIVFKVERIDGILTPTIVSGKVKEFNIDENAPDIPILTLNIENEKSYDLKIVKEKINTDYKIEGATFNILGKNLPETGSVLTTNEQGILILNDLVPGEIYTIKETKAPSNYEINEEVIQIKAVFNENNVLQVEKTDGNAKSIEVEGERTAVVTMEDEVKYSIEITKTKENSEEKLSGVKFEVQGKDKDNTIYETNENGIATIEELHLGETYKIKETYAKGYYIDENEKTITLKRENGVLVLESDGNYKTAPALDETGLFPIVKFGLENEEIPKYTLELTKLEEGTTTVLQGANFKIEGNGREIKEEINYTTNSEGRIIITNLYENEEYTLTETLAPEGYVLEEEPIKFVAKRDEQNTLTFTINSGTLKDDINIEEQENTNPVIKVNMENKPLFKLTKVDKETKEPLVGAKFIIQKTDANGNIIDYAKDNNGNYVGILEDNKYVLQTNEKGVISCALEGGFYKATEIEAPSGYKLEENEEDRVTYFTIEGYEDLKINFIEDLVKLSVDTKDGNNYAGKIVTLERTLDFNNDSSYKNPNDTSFGDYNEDGITEGIKAELTNTSGRGFYPITDFYGIFNGKNNEIQNIYINNSNLSNVGLFQKIYGTICNLGITGNITSTKSSGKTGGIVGENSGTITNCYNEGTVTSTTYAGGIAGNNYTSGTITSCYNTGIITSKDYSGGIVGENSGTIANCYDGGTITSTSSDGHVGGIIGYNSSSGTITNCYNKGIVKATGSFTYIGGIVGFNSGIITNCYNKGTLKSAYDYVGGIVGYNNSSGIVTKCYNTEEIIISGPYEEGGIVGENDGTIANCYNEGKIETKSNIETGGIAGRNFKGTIINCYNIGEITSELCAGGIVGFSKGTIINCYSIGNITVTLTSGDEGGIAGWNYSGGTITNCYYKSDTASKGAGSGTDTTTSMTDINMKAQSFVDTLNNNQSSITSDVELLKWVKTDTYPTMNIEFEKINKDEIGVISGAIPEASIVDKIITVTKITVENEKKEYTNPSEVIVHHYLQGTTTSVANDEIIKGEVGDSYTTSAKILDKYVVVESSMPSNASGNMTEENIEVTYVYIPKESKVIVHYYKDGTEEKLVEDEEKIGNVGDNYTTNYKIDIEGYKVVTDKLPENMNGEYSKDTIEVIYYYVQIPKGQVIVHYYLENSNYPLEADNEIENYIGTQYETNSKDDIQGYELIQELLPTNAKGTIIEGITEVIYYYKLKQYNITTSVNGGNGSISGENETPYEVVKYGENSGKELKIEPNEGYKTKTVTINGTNISFTEEENHIVYLDGFQNVIEDKDIVVTFEKIVSEGVTVKYLEYGTDIELLSEEKLNGYVGEAYTTQRKEIENYETIGIEPDNAEGFFAEEEQIVIYYYTKAQGKVVIKYVEQGTNIEISERVELLGECETSYDTREYIKDVENYDRLDVVTGTETGTFSKNEQEVIYYYKIGSGKVIVKYIEKDTGKEIEKQEEIDGNAGDFYDVEDLEKVIAGYVRTSDIPQNKEGTFTKETIEVIYYYELATPIITNTIQKTARTNKLLEESINNEDGTETKVYTPVITKEDELITYNITYKVTIQDYIGEATVELKDELPAEINIDKSDIAEGNYNSTQKNITWIENIEDINTYKNGAYTKIITKQITIAYENQDVVDDLINTAIGTTRVYYPDDHILKPSEERAKEETSVQTIVKQEYKVNLKIVKIWEDNENLKQKRPEDVTITVKNSLTDDNVIILNEENNWTYEIKDLPKYDKNTKTLINYEVIESETNENDLEYYEKADITKIETQTDEVTTYTYNVKNAYKLLNTNLNTKITKQGTEELTSSSQNVDYTIEFISEISDYIGKGKVKIVDYLPYEIDELKSVLNGGKYDEITKTITWEEELPHINTQTLGKNYNIDIVKQISVLYKDIDLTLNRIKNTVSGKVELYETDEKDEAQDEFNTNINVKGKVLIRYVDKDLKTEIEESEIIGKVGDAYQTQSKTIENYNYIESTENTTGNITEETIEVIYYYERIPASVLVKYEDTDGNKLLDDVLIEGKIFDEYKATRKKVENYKLVSVTDNEEGNMTKEQIVVVYKYERIPSGIITVKYVDIDTNESILYKEEKEDSSVEEKVYDYEIKGYVGEEYKTEDKEIPYYDLISIPENNKGILTEKSYTLIYYYKKQNFNISIDKEIKEITLNGEQKEINDNKIVKIEIPESELEKTTLQVKYNIIITNTEKIDGKVEIQEIVPEGFMLVEDNSNTWTKDEEGNLISELEINAGETKTLEITLQWDKNNLGTKENIAKIVLAKNVPNYEETTKEDNMETATIVISVKTGLKEDMTNIIYTVLVISLLTLFIVIRKKNENL